MKEKILDLSNDDYRVKEGVSNSDLILVERSASDYMWSKNAPRDNSKTGTADFGTALHTALLEPEKFNNEVLVWTNTKTRETKAFIEFAAEQDQSKVILLESEYDQIRFTVDGIRHHPAASAMLGMKSHNEASIFVKDEQRDIIRKIRPDMDCVEFDGNFLGDVKSTANLSDWRETARWKNPLFTHHYAHNAAYYLDTASMYYGESIDEYNFIVIQKAVEFGRYPVAVIKITREELDGLGAFDDMHYNLDKYATCFHANDWLEVERFPIFNGETIVEDVK